MSKWNCKSTGPLYVDPSNWNEKILIPELEIGNYPLLIAPSQSGKTTRVVKLIEQLKSKYFPIYIDGQSLIGEKKTPEEFWENFLLQFQKKVNNNQFPLFPFESKSFTLIFDNKLKDYFDGKECILIIDEIDALSNINEETRKIFLSTLRSLKQNKVLNSNEHCLHSVLGITNWVGKYIEDTITGSPFNVSNFNIASPFVKKLVMYSISNETLTSLPIIGKDIDIPTLIVKVIENMNILELITGEKVSTNTCLGFGPLGCKEIVYIESFQRSLKLTLSSYKSIM